jgi:hypothetical protein
MYRDTEIGLVFHHGVLARHSLPLRLAQVVGALFSLVYAVLFTRFLLIYVQAGASPFVQWVAKATDVVYVPLRQVLANGKDAAGHPIAWSLLALMAVLAVAQWSLVSWLREVARPGIPRED